MTPTHARLLGYVLIAGLLLTGGCLPSGTYQPTHFFTLEAVGPAAEKAPDVKATVMIRRFSTLPRYDYRMARRLSGVQITYDEYDRWVETPDELVANAFYNALLRKGLFAAVVPPDFSAPADYIVEGRVLAIELDTQNQARLSLELVLRRESDNQTLWRQRINATAPTPSSDPAALAKALSVSLDTIVARCVEDWRKLPELQAKK